MEKKEKIRGFLARSRQTLDQMQKDLKGLEGELKGTLQKTFRTIHTIKGTGGCLGLSKVESVAHVGEDLLALLRDETLTPTPEIVSALLNLSDGIRRIFSSLESTKQEGDEDYSPLIQRLTQLQNPDFSPNPPQGDDSPSPISPKNLPQIEDSPEMSYIQIPVGLLDKLMSLVGELVLTRNQIMGWMAPEENSFWTTVSQHLNLLTSDLQKMVMKTRMQPISALWDQYPSLIEKLTTDSGKKIRLEMWGKNTELDKSLMEAIKDPLVHLVRNAVDHGIETREDRLAQGKPEDGHLSLRAFHEGGQVHIELSDDGRGVDTQIIGQKAVEKGLITFEELEKMSHKDVENLIFIPGFSTAQKVTNLSGRGVGLDVVKTNLEKIGGTVEIESQVGQGTTIKLKFSLTLAIIPTLIVFCDGQSYAIPQINLVELVHLEEGSGAIEMVHPTPVYRLRDHLLPLVYLNDVLGLKKKHHQKSANIVVLQAENHRFGLVVDGIGDSQEIVVKPLSGQIKDIFAFAGSTILGDGKIALILDVIPIAQHCHFLSHEASRQTTSEIETQQADKKEDLLSLLIFRVGKKRQMALPLSQATRLERFSRSQVEKSGDHPVVQYRGQILPLLHLWKFFHLPDEERAEEGESVFVVVHSEEGEEKHVGLVVDQIVDIVDIRNIKKRTLYGNKSRREILGTSVVGNRVTDLVNLQEILESLAL